MWAALRHGHQAAQLDHSQRQILTQLARLAADMVDRYRRASEADLPVAEFSVLHQFASVGIFAVGSEGLCLKVNAKWSLIYEMTQEQALGTGWARRIHPDDRAAVRENLNDTTRERRDFDMELRLQMPDGRVKTIRALLRAFCGLDGALAGHSGAVDDVSAARSLQSSLREKQDRVAAILDSTGAAAFEWNVQSGATRGSESWPRMTGNTLAEFEKLTIQKWLAQLHSEDRAMVRNKSRSILPIRKCPLRPRSASAMRLAIGFGC